jgi:hypothetical protein
VGCTGRRGGMINRTAVKTIEISNNEEKKLERSVYGQRRTRRGRERRGW